MISKLDAEILAINVLGWLRQNEDVLLPFFAQTGAGMEHVREGAADPYFLASVMDFVMTQDEWVVSCAEHVMVEPQIFLEARAQLPGSEIPNWT